MKVWVVVLKGFGWVWVVLSSILIAAGIAGTWKTGGFSAVRELIKPTDLKMLMWIAPGIASLIWADKLSKKRGAVRQSS